MPESPLYDAVKSLEAQYHLTPYQRKQCSELFSSLKRGKLFYAGQLKSRLGIGIEESYHFLEGLKKQGFLKTVYEVYCGNCERGQGKFIAAFSDFNPDWRCNFCGAHLNAFDNLIALYEVTAV